MLSAAFTELCGCDVPARMTAMAGLATPPLVTAVSEAGGLGMLGVARMAVERLDAVDRLTARPYGANFQIPFLTDRDVVMLAAKRARPIEFFSGASGVRIGTRLIGATESNPHPAHVAALVATETGDTIYTERFSGDAAGARPSPSTGETISVKQFDAGTPTTTDAIEAMSLLAGESVGAVRSIQPAAKIVREPCDDAQRLISRRK